jgi:hypothetical protein
LKEERGISAVIYRILLAVLLIVITAFCPPALTSLSAHAEEEISCDDADGDRECDVTPENPE